MSDVTTVDRPYGRQPIALRGLARGYADRLRADLTHSGAIDNSVHVKAFWLREDHEGYGMADYRFAYVRMAPMVMSFALCEQIERIVKTYPRVLRTGRGGDPPEKLNALRPFVYAVVDRQP